MQDSCFFLDILPSEIIQKIRGLLGQCDLFALDTTCQSLFSYRPEYLSGIHPKVLACYYDDWSYIRSLFWPNAHPTEAEIESEEYYHARTKFRIEVSHYIRNLNDAQFRFIINGKRKCWLDENLKGEEPLVMIPSYVTYNMLCVLYEDRKWDIVDYWLGSNEAIGRVIRAIFHYPGPTSNHNPPLVQRMATLLTHINYQNLSRDDLCMLFYIAALYIFLSNHNKSGHLVVELLRMEQYDTIIYLHNTLELLYKQLGILMLRFCKFVPDILNYQFYREDISHSSIRKGIYYALSYQFIQHPRNRDRFFKDNRFSRWSTDWFITTEYNYYHYLKQLEDKSMKFRNLARAKEDARKRHYKKRRLE